MAAHAPWSHVTPAERTALRQAYLAGLRDRVALHEPPVPIPCPSRACLMCGVGSVDRSAIEVHRRGGVPATVGAVWRAVEGPGVRAGHLCPECSRAVDDVGAVGPTATARAVLACAPTWPLRDELAPIGGLRGLRLRIEQEGVRVPTWAEVGGGRPNLFAWSHVSKLLDRLAEELQEAT